MTTPKSPEQVVKEFLTDFPATNDSDSKELSMYQRKVIKDFLRSSMASLLCYMAERMPEKINAGSNGEMICDVYIPENEGRNKAIDDCRTLLIEEARKILEK